MARYCALKIFACCNPSPRRGRFSLWVTVTAFVFAIVSSTPTLARIVPVGPVFQVNTFTPGRQDAHRVAALSDGSFVVVWQSEGQDGDGSGVFGKRFTQGGEPENEFRVNSVTVGLQTRPALAAARDGSFLVVWQDSTTGHIRGQRFNAIPSPVGGEFEVDGEDLNVWGPFSPRAAGRERGDFVVTWAASGQGYILRGRSLSENGTPKGTPFTVTEDPIDLDGLSSLAARQDESFVVVWELRFDGPDLIRARLLEDSGSPLTTEINVGRSSAVTTCRTDVCSTGQGEFIVTWDATGVSGDGSNGDLVFYRRYDHTAEPITQVLEAASREGTADQVCPSIACTARGDFILTFREFCRESQFFGITGRRFPGGSAQRAEEFRIGLPAFGGGSPKIATLGEDDFVVVWAECPSREDCDLFGQRFSVSDVLRCEGDCNADGEVTVDELITGVNIALEPSTTGTRRCLAADTNLDGLVSVDELVSAVGRALGGCIQGVARIRPARSGLADPPHPGPSPPGLRSLATGAHGDLCIRDQASRQVVRLDVFRSEGVWDS